MGKRNAMIIGSAAYLIDGILFLAAKDNMILNYAAVVFFGIGLTVFFTTIWGGFTRCSRVWRVRKRYQGSRFLIFLGRNVQQSREWT